MTDRVCRGGILGAAQVAHKNWKAIRNAGNCELVAVASRDLPRARQFVAECQADAPLARAPRAVGSYEELLADPSIDAVYLPLPTLARKPWAIRAAEAGKHVLCEKPVGRDASDVQEIVDACRKNRVQFMDGVMFMHSRRLDAMRQVLDDGQSVGRIKRIMSQFSFGGSDEFLRENIRMNSRLEPLGCLALSGQPDPVWGQLSWKTQRVLDACLRSARAGGVQVPLNP
jgi:predicted dehydrogenase